MVVFQMNERDGSKQWFVVHAGVTYSCTSKGVAQDLSEMFKHGAIKIVD